MSSPLLPTSGVQRGFSSFPSASSLCSPHSPVQSFQLPFSFFLLLPTLTCRVFLSSSACSLFTSASLSFRAAAETGASIFPPAPAAGLRKYNKIKNVWMDHPGSFSSSVILSSGCLPSMVGDPTYLGDTKFWLFAVNGGGSFHDPDEEEVIGNQNCQEYSYSECEEMIAETF